MLIGDGLEGVCSICMTFAVFAYNILVVFVIFLVCTNACAGVKEEILGLQHVFSKIYHYKAADWQIPSKSAFNALRRKLNDFLNEYDGETNLLIVYYGGHGFMDKERRCMWSWCVIHAS